SVLNLDSNPSRQTAHCRQACGHTQCASSTVVITDSRFMTFTKQQSQARVARSQKLIPGGVNSPARAFGAVGGSPVIMDRADGAYLSDIDGNRYLDYIGSWGPHILGHRHPAVIEAILAALEKGTSFGAPCEL